MQITKQNLILIILASVVAGVIIGASFWMYEDRQDKDVSVLKPNPNVSVSNFEECVAAGNPVMESYPRQCRHGKTTFVEEVEIPVRPPTESEDRAQDGCIISGCSGQVCGDEEEFTTCEYRAEFACYNNIVCRRQDSGECGWDQSEELNQCLQAAENFDLEEVTAIY